MSTQQFYKSGSIWIHRPDPYFFSSKQIISYLLKYIFNIKKSDYLSAASGSGYVNILKVGFGCVIKHFQPSYYNY